MRNASSEYKEIMDRHIRNRGYVSVELGIVNQDAQKSGKVTSECVDYCNKDSIFGNNIESKVYATMEQNLFKTDGSMYFLPEENQIVTNCAISNDILGDIRIEFDDFYSLKGLTINFGQYYPTEFVVQSAEVSLRYINNSSNFQTSDVFGETNYITISPVSIIGGQKRLRIYSIVMGIGLTFSNSDVKDVSSSDSVSMISEELPSFTSSINLFDKENLFNVEDNNSYIQYLEMMQKVTVSFGLELDNGQIEWIKYSTLYLSNWDSQKGILSINAIDRIAALEDEYTMGNRIYTRTAYEEAELIFSDAGLTSDEYVIDDYLKNVVLENPMPNIAHRECLQLLANACRCVLLHDPDGRIIIKSNFANIVGPEDVSIETNGVTEWSTPENILNGSKVLYADMTANFFKTDGSMYFLPEVDSYLQTSYVSNQISNAVGLFSKMPIIYPAENIYPGTGMFPVSSDADTSVEDPEITIKLSAAYAYYGISIKFDGNIPKQLVVNTYNGDAFLESIEFSELKKVSVLQHEFLEFDKIAIKFIETTPYSRILVNEIAFEELASYKLMRDHMLENPHGYAGTKTKSVNVRVFSFANDEKNEPYEIEDNVYVKNTIGAVGKNIILENQLISTQSHAEKVAKWLANYYANNISYDISYRGEPRIIASDIIGMESTIGKNIQAQVAKQEFKFNGVFSGFLELRKALKLI